MVKDDSGQRVDTRALTAEIGDLVRALLARREDGDTILAALERGERTLRMGFDERERILTFGLRDSGGKIETLDTLFCGDHEHAGRALMDVLVDAYQSKHGPIATD